MKENRLFRWLKRAGIALAALLVVAAVVMVVLFRKPWPQLSGRLVVPGLAHAHRRNGLRIFAGMCRPATTNL